MLKEMKAYHYIIGFLLFLFLTLAATGDSQKRQRQQLRLPIALPQQVVSKPQANQRVASQKEKDDRNDRIVACTILAEARGETEVGMYAVAAVIAQRALNRKKHPVDICLQRKQFSCWNNKSLDAYNHLLHIPQAEYALKVARLVNQGYETNNLYIQRQLYGYADHYHAKGVKPYWIKGQTPVKTFGNHIFYRLNKNPVKGFVTYKEDITRK
jgi:spore germination cell wall hydrolase CwlJ-like protein